MNIKPIKTKTFIPPQDDMYRVFDEYLPKLQERDVVVITSKIVAIHQGRCIPLDEADKDELIAKEADYYMGRLENGFSVTIKDYVLAAGAGIDESNANGHYVLLPENPFGAAKEIREYLKVKHDVHDLGVIITDSHSYPFRFGQLSISIGFWGIEPIKDYVGNKDLFGRVLEYKRLNVVDGLSVMAGYISGEGAESIPITIIQDAPDVEFTEEDVRHKLLIEPKEDLYYPLYKHYIE